MTEGGAGSGGCDGTHPKGSVFLLRPFGSNGTDSDYGVTEGSFTGLTGRWESRKTRRGGKKEKRLSNLAINKKLKEYKGFALHIGYHLRIRLTISLKHTVEALSLQL